MDGEDWHTLKTTKLKSLAKLFKPFKVQLTPKIFLPLMKTTSFLYYISEKIILIGKIPPILQRLKLYFHVPRPSMVGSGLGLFWCHRRTLLETLKRHLTGFQALWKHIWGICASYFVKNGQDFQMKEVYHLAIQYGVYLRLARLQCIYSGTPLYGHPVNTDTPSLRTVWHSPTKSSYISLKNNPLNTDTR